MYAHADADPDADSYTKTYFYAHADADSYTKTYSDTQAAPIPRPSPDSPTVRRKPLRRSKVDGSDSASRCPCLCTDATRLTTVFGASAAKRSRSRAGQNKDTNYTNCHESQNT